MFAIVLTIAFVVIGVMILIKLPRLVYCAYIYCFGSAEQQKKLSRENRRRFNARRKRMSHGYPF